MNIKYTIKQIIWSPEVVIVLIYILLTLIWNDLSIYVNKLYTRVIPVNIVAILTIAGVELSPGLFCIRLDESELYKWKDYYMLKTNLYIHFIYIFISFLINFLISYIDIPIKFNLLAGHIFIVSNLIAIISTISTFIAWIEIRTILKQYANQ